MNFNGAVSILSVWSFQFLSGVLGIIWSESAPAYFQSLPICGGQTLSNHTFEHGEESLSTLMETATQELLEAAVFVGDIINHIEKRVRFTYSDIPCISSFSRTFFHLSSGSYDNDTGESIRHDYLETFKLLSVLQFIISEESDNPSESDQLLIHKTIVLRGHLYEALCSMNKAVLKLGYRGYLVSRRVYVRQTTNMCQIDSLLDGHARDLGLFRLIRKVSRTLFDRFYSRNNCPALVFLSYHNLFH